MGTKKNDKRLAYLYLVITTSAWGSLYVASKYALASIPPLTLLFLRYLISTAALFAVLKARKKTVFERSDIKYLFFVGLVGYTLSIGAQMMGMKLASASVASLINALNPVCIILFAMPILKERITAPKIVALASSVIGAYVILGGSTSGANTLGIVFSLISVALWSLMSVVMRRITQKYDPIAVTAYGIAIAMVATLPASIAELATTPHGAIFTLPNLACVLYMSLVCTALAHFLWNKSLSMMEAGRCSLFYPLQPLVATALGALLLGERVTASFVAGGALIICGVLIGVFAGTDRGRAAKAS
jgi:drug/metabolite transporter (DMT)-like permease